MSQIRDFVNLPRLTKIQILSNIDYDDVPKYCELDEETSKICNDVKLWARKASINFDLSEDVFIEESMDIPLREYLEAKDYYEQYLNSMQGERVLFNQITEDLLKKYNAKKITLDMVRNNQRLMLRRIIPYVEKLNPLNTDVMKSRIANSMLMDYERYIFGKYDVDFSSDRSNKTYGSYEDMYDEEGDYDNEEEYDDIYSNQEKEDYKRYNNVYNKFILGGYPEYFINDKSG